MDICTFSHFVNVGKNFEKSFELCFIFIQKKIGQESKTHIFKFLKKIPISAKFSSIFITFPLFVNDLFLNLVLFVFHLR